MKRTTIIIALVALASCSSTRFVDSWKNREIVNFEPQRLLVIGMTDNLTARKIFEGELKTAFLQHNINAVESSAVIDRSFTDTKKSEVEVDAMVKELLESGFDTVVITAVKGVDERRDYSPGHYTVDYRWVRFGRYYYMYQDVFHSPDYHSDYKVYHVETSIYNINQDDAKSLVWVGSFNIVDPQTITPIVKDYVARIIGQLEREGLLDKAH